MQNCEFDRARARLRALARYKILDTTREKEFDVIVELAAQICETPIAMIKFIDGRRQWLKAEVGLGLTETLLDQSLCKQVMDADSVVVIPDVTLNKSFEQLDEVRDLHIRFYAGAPLRTEAGTTIGTLCVIGKTPRSLTELQRMTLSLLAKQVMLLLERRLLPGPAGDDSLNHGILSEAEELPFENRVFFSLYRHYVEAIILEHNQLVEPLENALETLIDGEDAEAALSEEWSEQIAVFEALRSFRRLPEDRQAHIVEFLSDLDKTKH